MAFGDKRGFTRHHGEIELRVDAVEASVLRELFGQVAVLVEPGETDDAEPLGELLGLGEGERPDDPALLRLFPDGYREDDEAAGDFRRFTERGLREGKAERLALAAGVLRRVPEDPKPRPVRLSAAEVDAFLRSLNDLRLVLGVRLGIVDDEQEVDAAWDPDDPRQATYGAYQWLTWLQSTLLESLAERS